MAKVEGIEHEDTNRLNRIQQHRKRLVPHYKAWPFVLNAVRVVVVATVVAIVVVIIFVVVISVCSMTVLGMIDLSLIGQPIIRLNTQGLILCIS